tara:strand:+ start:563 stop:760 length:198 start_codon:yes stop_codon:yes gene_type:complete
VEFLLVVAVVETDIIMVPLKQEVLVVAEKVDYFALQVLLELQTLAVVVVEVVTMVLVEQVAQVIY